MFTRNRFTTFTRSTQRLVKNFAQHRNFSKPMLRKVASTGLFCLSISTLAYLTIKYKSKMKPIIPDVIAEEHIHQEEENLPVLGMKNYKFPTKKLREGTPDAPRVVLVACGSYNPPTFLHLRLFEAARDKLEKEMGIEVIGGYMSPVHPAYGKTGLVSGEHRYNMCKRAVASSDWIDVDPWEILQEGYTRTLPVLEHFDQEVRKALKNSNNVRVSLLCGADLVESFAIPNVWRTEDLVAILNNHGVVALERKGVDIPRIIFEHDILFENSSKIITVNSRIDNDVSSSKIRRFLGRGFSVKYCIPDPVLEYIKEHELYTPQSIKRDIRDFGDKK